MLRLLSDENFNQKAIDGLLKRRPELDLVRVVDVGLKGIDDPQVLAWAGAEDRIVVTHDLKTMPGFAAARMARGEPMPGLFVVDDLAPIRRVIDDLLILDSASEHTEWADRIEFIPL